MFVYRVEAPLGHRRLDGIPEGAASTAPDEKRRPVFGIKSVWIGNPRDKAGGGNPGAHVEAGGRKVLIEPVEFANQPNVQSITPTTAPVIQVAIAPPIMALIPRSARSFIRSGAIPPMPPN